MPPRRHHHNRITLMIVVKEKQQHSVRVHHQAASVFNHAKATPLAALDNLVTLFPISQPVILALKQR